jgi:hypothetical protein
VHGSAACFVVGIWWDGQTHIYAILVRILIFYPRQFLSSGFAERAI